MPLHGWSKKLYPLTAFIKQLDIKTVTDSEQLKITLACFTTKDFSSSHQSAEVTYHECTNRCLFLVVLYVNVDYVNTLWVGLLS